MNDAVVELTILMPCLNEAETLEVCINKAQQYLNDSGVQGEVLVADNGSTDGSQAIAERCGARVVDVPIRGYGAALITGTKEAHGTYIIMADADDSYDFLHLQPFVDKLREGYDLVMGNRFKGGIADGAMPPLHKYLGNPVLSGIGRTLYKSGIGDFHCGLRGYSRERILALGLKTTGMEYASEMVVAAELNGLKIAEVPTTLKKDGRSHPPHLRSWHDGWRHLKFLLIHAPNWLFVAPGIIALILGALIMAILAAGPLQTGAIVLDVHTMIYGAALAIIGATVLMFAVFTGVYAETHGFLPLRPNSVIRKITPEASMLVGLVLFLAGILIAVIAFAVWGQGGFSDLNPSTMMRATIPSVAMIVIGCEAMFAGFFIGILRH